METYDTFNPVFRVLFEARVHSFISRRNEETYTALLGSLGAVERLTRPTPPSA